MHKKFFNRSNTEAEFFLHLFSLFSRNLSKFVAQQITSRAQNYFVSRCLPFSGMHFHFPARDVARRKSATARHGTSMENSFRKWKSHAENIFLVLPENLFFFSLQQKSNYRYQLSSNYWIGFWLKFNAESRSENVRERGETSNYNFTHKGKTSHC